MKRLFIVVSFVAFVLVVPAVHLLAQGAVSIRAEDALFLKIVTTRDCQLYSAPTTLDNGAPCPAMSCWYVLPPDPDAEKRSIENLDSITKYGFYRVASGNAENEFKGWIHRDDAIEWRTNRAFMFTRRQKGTPVRFYRTPWEALDSEESGVVGEPCFVETDTGMGNRVIMPLLESWDIRSNGDDMTLHRVCIGYGDTVRVQKLDKTDILDTATVDIVFVINTTAGMGPPIRYIRKAIGRFIEECRDHGEFCDRVRIGLVGFRDTSDGSDPGDLEYLTKVFCNLEEGRDHGLLMKRMNNIKIPKRKTDDHPEDALAGVIRAMSVEEMKWNEAGWKQIIVVGTSSIKGPHHEIPAFRRSGSMMSIDEVMTMAQTGGASSEEMQRPNFVISAILIEDSEFEEDFRTARSHYKMLVAGRTYSGDMIHVEKGSQGEDFTSELARGLLKKVENFRDVIQTGQRQMSTEPEQPRMGMPFFRRPIDFGAGDRAGERVEIVMRYIEGYCIEYYPERTRRLVPVQFVRLGNIDSFRYVLRFLMNLLDEAGSAGQRDVESIKKGLNTVSLSLNTRIATDMPIARLLQALLGAPLKSPEFYISIDELAGMSQANYNTWVSKVDARMGVLDDLIENPNLWFLLHPDARHRQFHAFMDIADLP